MKRKFHLIQKAERPRLYLTRDLFWCAVCIVAPIVGLIWGIG